MDDAEHFRNFHRFLNPAVTARFDYDPLATFRPEKSIQENCWLSECVGLPDSGFFMDDHYHAILTLRQWPKGTFPGLIRRLTAQRILDYSITVNVAPLPVRAEILKEEKAHDRVAGDYAAEKRVSFLSVLAKKERKIKALMDGVTLPFKTLFIVRIWDRTREGLAASTAAIKSAINSMNGAQYFEANVATTTKKLFYMSWLGWAWGKYTAHGLYAESHYLPDLLPFSSTFTGHLATAEAIYDGDEQNIVGIKTFSGEAGNVSPQHAVVLGMSGGQEIVSESYAQLRKFNVWNVSIVQQYARFKNSGIRPVVFGNSKQFLLMKQNDRADLDDIGRDIALPEIVRRRIMGYPLPEQPPASALFWKPAADHPSGQGPVGRKIPPVGGQHFGTWGRLGQPHHARICKTGVQICVFLQPAQQLRHMLRSVETHREIARHKHLQEWFRASKQVGRFGQDRLAGKERCSHVQAPRPTVVCIRPAPERDEKPGVSDLRHDVSPPAHEPGPWFPPISRRATLPTRAAPPSSARAALLWHATARGPCGHRAGEPSGRTKAASVVAEAACPQRLRFQRACS